MMYHIPIVADPELSSVFPVGRFLLSAIFGARRFSELRFELIILASYKHNSSSTAVVQENGFYFFSIVSLVAYPSKNRF